MEEIEKRNLVVKASMRAGISIGGFLILRFFVSSYSGDFPLVGFLSMLLFFLTAALMYKYLIDLRKDLNGEIAFGVSFRFCIYTFFFASFLLVIFTYIFYTVIEPAFITDQVKQVLSTFEKMKVDPKYINLLRENPPPSAFNLALQQIWLKILEGIFWGVILSFIIKKRLPHNDSQLSQE